MKPLNSNERAIAFYKVIVSFVICFVLAMVLGFSTMNVNKVMDYASRKQLEGLKNNLTFQEKIFRPNIDDATRKLNDLANYKTKVLDLNATKGDIETSLKKIMSEWKVNEKDQQYIMYKNIVDTYFALESAYDAKFKLEDQLEAKENVVKVGSGDLQHTKDLRDELEKANTSLKSEKDILSNNVSNLQGQVTRLQNQLDSCRNSLRNYRDINKALEQQIKKSK